MYRYCPECDKNIDFKITNPKELDNLVCPYCNNPIDKNSRPPVKGASEDKVNATIGNTFATINFVFYIIYFVVAVIGIVAFFVNGFTVTYACTGILAILLVIGIITGGYRFAFGLIAMPAGAVIGYLIFKSIQGAFAGALMGFAIYFIIRYMIISLIFSIIRWASKQ